MPGSNNNEWIRIMTIKGRDSHSGFAPYKNKNLAIEAAWLAAESEIVRGKGEVTARLVCYPNGVSEKRTGDISLYKPILVGGDGAGARFKSSTRTFADEDNYYIFGSKEVQKDRLQRENVMALFNASIRIGLTPEAVNDTLARTSWQDSDGVIHRMTPISFCPIKDHVYVAEMRGRWAWIVVRSTKYFIFQSKCEIRKKQTAHIEGTSQYVISFLCFYILLYSSIIL